MDKSRLNICPDCNGRKMRTSARCDPCYRKARIANHNELRVIPSPQAEPTTKSAPMDPWHQPPSTGVVSRTGPRPPRYRMNIYGEWETVEP
jgi:hypothetical protein